MIQIREPKLRFKADDGSEFLEWEEHNLSMFLEENRLRNVDLKFDKNDVLSVSGDYGVVNQIEFQGRSFAGKSVQQYHILPHNGIVYTKSPLKANPYGIIKANKGVAGIVSTLYAVFDCKDNVISEFVDAYFDLDERLNKYLKPLVNIGAKHDMKISNERFLSGRVCFPSLPEQKRIAEFLSTIDEIITTTEAELTAWQVRKKGVMQKIFNREVRFKADDGSEFPEWEERRIDSFANCYAGATPSTKVAVYWQNGSIPWMSSGEVNNREIYETEKKISELGYEKSSTKMIEPNTVVIALAGQGKTRGMVAITRISVCTNQSLCAIKTNDMVNDDYLYQYLITQYDNLRRISSGDGTRGGLNLQLVGEYKVFLPVLPEQRKIADCLSSLDDVISNIQEELSAWKEFKKGLLQQMFV